VCYLVHSIDSYKYCLLVDYNFWPLTEQDVCSKGVCSSSRGLIMGCLGIQVTSNFKVSMQGRHLFQFSVLYTSLEVYIVLCGLFSLEPFVDSSGR
jgi:hypothetical protein